MRDNRRHVWRQYPEKLVGVELIRRLLCLELPMGSEVAETFYLYAELGLHGV